MSEKSTLMSVKSTLKLILPTLKLILPTLKLILSTLKLIFPTLKLILPTLKLAKREEKNHKVAPGSFRRPCSYVDMCRERETINTMKSDGCNQYYRFEYPAVFVSFKS